MCSRQRQHTRVVTPRPTVLSFTVAIKRCTRVAGRGQIAGKLQERVRGTPAESSSTSLVHLYRLVSNMERLTSLRINHFSSVDEMRSPSQKMFCRILSKLTSWIEEQIREDCRRRKMSLISKWTKTPLNSSWRMIKPRVSFQMLISMTPAGNSHSITPAQL